MTAATGLPLTADVRALSLVVAGYIRPGLLLPGEPGCLQMRPGISAPADG
jgi:hypothetical protein